MVFDRISQWLKDAAAAAGLPSALPELPPETRARRQTAREHVVALLNEVPDDRYWSAKLSDFPAGRALLAAPPEIQTTAVLEALDRIAGLDTLRSKNAQQMKERELAKRLFLDLLRRRLPFGERELCYLVSLKARQGESGFGILDPSPASLLRQVGFHAEQRALSIELRAALRQLKSSLARHVSSSKEIRELTTRIEELLGATRTVALNRGEPWADALLERIDAMAADPQQAWKELLEYAGTAEQARPSGKWLKDAEPLIEAIGADALAAELAEILPLVGQPATGRTGILPTGWVREPTIPLERNATILRGLVWCCARLEPATVARLLGDLAEVCFKKVPWHGPRCSKVGNACLYTLGVLNAPEAMAELSRLKARTGKTMMVRKMLSKALDTAAEQAGMSAEDLEEVSLPTFGMQEPGRLRRNIGEYMADLTVTGSRRVELRWTTTAGKVQKSVPADVKSAHAAELKEIQRTAQDIKRMLPACRDRIERLFLSERSWDLGTWRQRYLEHPLMSAMAQRLIWDFTCDDRAAEGIWSSEHLVDHENLPLTLLNERTRVQLWHPLGKPTDRVLAWRRWLEEHEVCQPFKQAHRELYIITDAEMQTATYSNRFAGHVLKQHQLAALCRERGWQHILDGQFDSGSTGPTLQLPRWNLRVEFWTQAAGEDASGAGIYLYLSTDQVRFYPLGVADVPVARSGNMPEPVPLTEVPAILFSEVMRDVDLFVGVASIGNDPQWRDSGPVAYANYWHSFAFGELGASAQVRRETLARLLPRLKIADRCALEDRYLVVRGDRGTYKIHLGSGNVLTDSGRYLCIVAGTTADESRGTAFLPYEGDMGLSLILSKAFLLADDTKIKDATILAQMRA